MEKNNSQLDALRALHKLYSDALNCATLRIGVPDDYHRDDKAAREARRRFSSHVDSLLMKIALARQKLVASGFDAPIEWLAVQVIGERKRKIDEEGFVQEEYGGVEVQTLRRVCNEIWARILKLENSPARNGDWPQADKPHDAKLSPRDLARKHGVGLGALNKRLGRWRYEHDAGYVEVSNAAKNEPKYLYDEAAVLPVIEAIKVALRQNLWVN